ncbi:MAG TPA: hypothetical protein VFR35_10860 [Actinoplanes sp.]|nr:hypothetical protein [Actinoplanes sp.]
MRPYRILSLLIATAAALLIAPAAAHAEPYPAEPPASTISDGTVADGGGVIFSGAGFLPGETISISISYEGSDSTAAFEGESAARFVLAAATLPRRAAISVIASEEGTFSIRLKLSEVGTATLVAIGLTSGVTVTQTVEVVAGSDGDGGGDGDDDTSAGGGSALPTTGPSGRGLAFTLYVGLGAILAGAGTLWFLRRRRRPTE